MSYKSLALFGGLLLASIAAYPLYSAYVASTDQTSQAKWNQRAQSIDASDAQLKALSVRIQALHGDGQCDRDDQCHVAGLGTRTCGLFKDFLVYSTKDAQLPELLQVIEEFNRVHHALSDVILSANQCGNKPAATRCLNHRCSADTSAH